jgi:sodium transport system permease protein
MFKQAIVITRKEVVDHLRETRSWASSLLHLLLGPFVFLLVSFSLHRGSGAGTMLSAMMSIFVLVAVFTGGMNIAMDIVAGERERRSLLPLLLTPVTRLTVVTGKWLAVSVFSILGIAVTLSAFAVIFRLIRVSSPLLSGSGFITWTVLGLGPLAFFAAALEVAISTACRTTKEAYTYLSLLIFAPMAVGMYCVFFPDHLGAWALFVPVAGQQIIAERGIRTGHWSLVQTPVLVLATAWFTALLIKLAGKMLSRDEVVYG